MRMHRAAAATIPTTIPVVLLDSRITSAEPGYGSRPPTRVGLAVGNRIRTKWLLSFLDASKRVNLSTWCFGESVTSLNGAFSCRQGHCNIGIQSEFKRRWLLPSIFLFFWQINFDNATAPERSAGPPSHRVRYHKLNMSDRLKTAPPVMLEEVILRIKQMGLADIDRVVFRIHATFWCQQYQTTK